MILTDVYHFDYKMLLKIPLQKRRRGNQGTNDRRYYKDIICAFDIETSKLHTDESFMYLWSFQFGDDITIQGRHWFEFKKLLKGMEEYLKENIYVCIFVHNLSFEFSFLKGIFNFLPDDVFCLESRKVLKADLYKHFEFRCSYLQSNMSLAELTKKYGRIRKMSGKKFDYSKLRYPWTRLTRSERKYSVNDVRSLVSAIKDRMVETDDNLYTLPLTATGYIRRICKKEMRSYPRKYLQDMMPDVTIMEMLLEAYRGGNVHANRYYVGDIIENVHSIDIASAYPAAQITEEFPMGAWVSLKDERNLTIDTVIRKMENHKALLLRFTVWDVQLSNPLNPIPYLANHKCRKVYKPVLDNGRICKADYLETTMTDVDFAIFIRTYEFSDIRIINLAETYYRKLPSQLTNIAKDLYFKKTLLKTEDPKEYDRAKSLLNSIYGCSVTNPVKHDTKLIDGEFRKVMGDFEEKLEKANRKAFQAYSWGVWICAHARAKLEKGIEYVGYENFIYADTDSIKFIGEHDIDLLNRPYKERALDNGCVPSDAYGKAYPIGIFEEEKGYDRFITWGAKKYAFEQEGKLGITVAGVKKKEGAVELAKKGGLDAFRNGFVFLDAGGTEARYEDNYQNQHIIDGHELMITDYCTIKDSTYTMGLTDDFLRIIEHPQLWLDFEDYNKSMAD